MGVSVVKVHSIVNIIYVSRLSMIPGSNLSDINLFLREILLSILSFLFLKRPNIANLKADVFCSWTFELKTEFLGYLKGRVLAGSYYPSQRD